MSRLRTGERGFTLIEVMLVCTLFLVVLGATLTAFTAFSTNHRRGEKQLEQAETARRGLDVAARQLRNLANPTVNASTTVDRALPYDFIFQTSDPAKTWVRYCTQTTGTGSPGLAICHRIRSISVRPRRMNVSDVKPYWSPITL